MSLVVCFWKRIGIASKPAVFVMLIYSTADPDLAVKYVFGKTWLE